jgi:AcrR family transcriptional regulator
MAMEANEPKRRDAIRTKARILVAAHAVFAEQGYARAGLREIAQRAEVAPSLLIRHFRTKAELFEAALADTIARNSLFTFDKADFGATMARLMLERSNVDITAMLVLALGDPESQEAIERVTRTRIIAPLADWLGPPDAFGRALSLFSLMTGFTVLARSLGQAAIPEPSLHWLAVSLQAIVDAAPDGAT